MRVQYMHVHVTGIYPNGVFSLIDYLLVLIK